jgi:hypothetical protein
MTEQATFARGSPIIYNVIDRLSQCQLDLLSAPTIPAEKSGPCSFQAAGKRSLMRRNTVFFIEKYRIHPLYSFAHQTYKGISMERRANNRRSSAFAKGGREYG